MKTRSPKNCQSRPAAPAWAAMALAALGAVAEPSVAATFIAADRTEAGGNPINSNYSGQGVFVGVDGALNRIAHVKVDVIDPAQLNYSDQTGGGLGAYSNSVVNVRGGSFGQYSPTGCCGGASRQRGPGRHRQLRPALADQGATGCRAAQPAGGPGL